MKKLLFQLSIGVIVLLQTILIPNLVTNSNKAYAWQYTDLPAVIEPYAYDFTKVFDGVYDATVDSQGNLFIAHLNPAAITKFDSDHNYIYSWSGFNGHPFGVTVDSQDNIIIATSDDKLYKYDNDGNFINVWGTYGVGVGQLNSVSDVAVDDDDNIYVTHQHKVTKFASDGSYITEISSFGNNGGVAVDADGNIYVSFSFEHRINKYNSSGTFLTSWGSLGTGNNNFNTPKKIELDSAGNLLIVDLFNNRIKKHSPSGTYISQFGSTGSGNNEFLDIAGLAITSTDQIYVLDAETYLNTSGQIRKFSENGVYIETLDFQVGSGVIKDVNDLHIDNLGRLIATSYGQGGLNQTITVYDENGDFSFEFGSEGTLDGEFSWAEAIATDSNNNIFIVDSDSSRIQKFDSNGNFLLKWGEEGSNPGQLSYPYYGILTDTDDNVYVLDNDNYRIQKYSNNGVFITGWGTSGTGPGQFGYVEGIGIDSLNNIYVSDTYNSRIQKFDSNGTFLLQWSVTGRPGDMAINSDNIAFVVFPEEEKIEVFDTSTAASIIEYDLFGSHTDEIIGPFRIAIDADDNLFVLHDSHRISKLTFDREGAAISITSLLNNELLDNVAPVFSGNATDSLGTISSVTYSLNGGTPVSCDAQDGLFDSANEDYNCDLQTPLPIGEYTLTISVTDDSGTVSTIEYEFSVVGTEDENGDNNQEEVIDNDSDNTNDNESDNDNDNDENRYIPILSTTGIEEEDRNTEDETIVDLVTENEEEKPDQLVNPPNKNGDRNKEDDENNDREGNKNVSWWWLLIIAIILLLYLRKKVKKGEIHPQI